MVDEETERGTAVLPRSERGGRSGQKFPVRALLLPVHQDVEIGGAFLAIGDGFALAHPMKPHDGSIADHPDFGVLIFQRPNFKQSNETLLLQMADSGAVDRPALAPIGFGIISLREKGAE